eukprot:snap_masked-scaffold_3-processed-gene-15.36-mRNA-1 protein AED:1.00 eAED:1.00 QI:0/-1/0/0/-1/1/1/0/240
MGNSYIKPQDCISDLPRLLQNCVDRYEPVSTNLNSLFPQRTQNVEEAYVVYSKDENGNQFPSRKKEFPAASLRSPSISRPPVPLEMTEKKFINRTNLIKRKESEQTVLSEKSTDSEVEKNLPKVEEISIPVPEEELKLYSTINIVRYPFEIDISAKNLLVKNWFLVEAKFFNQWSSFVQTGKNQPSKICNENLLDGSEFKPHLAPGKDYVGLEEPGWNSLKALYEADIEIKRSNLNIYEL